MTTAPSRVVHIIVDHQPQLLLMLLLLRKQQINSPTLSRQPYLTEQILSSMFTPVKVCYIKIYAWEIMIFLLANRYSTNYHFD